MVSVAFKLIMLSVIVLMVVALNLKMVFSLRISRNFLISNEKV